MKIRLLDIAHARSGDKGDTANVGLIALKPEWYEVLRKYVTRDAATAQVQTYFEPGPTINTSSNNLSLQGGAGNAGNVELQLLNADHSQVLLGNPLGLQNTQSVAVESGGAALRYYAQYVATGAATAGAANSSVTFTMIYQ